MTERVFGYFLTWLQDKKSPVFVAATANGLNSLPPEFLRQGRFDEIFFVGLPSKAEREEILGIQLAKRRREPAGYERAAVAEETEFFSGAELEPSDFAGLPRREVILQRDGSMTLSGVAPLARSR